MTERICPGCGKRCSLDEPKCGRGIEFARTGVLPERKPREEGERHSHGGHRGRRHAERMESYRALPQDGRIAQCILDIAQEILSRKDGGENAEDTQHGGLFTCLREDERDALLLALEKICRRGRRG